MALTITRIDRLGTAEVLVYPQNYVGHAKCPCDACRKPYGEYVDTKTGDRLGFGPDSGGSNVTAAARLVATFDEYAAHGKDPTGIERVGYGDCKQATKVVKEAVAFTLSDGRMASVTVAIGADDAVITAAIAAWAKANPSHSLVGSAV